MIHFSPSNISKSIILSNSSDPYSPHVTFLDTSILIGTSVHIKPSTTKHFSSCHPSSTKCPIPCSQVICDHPNNQCSFHFNHTSAFVSPQLPLLSPFSARFFFYLLLLFSPPLISTCHPGFHILKHILQGIHIPLSQNLHWHSLSNPLTNLNTSDP